MSEGAKSPLARCLNAPRGITVEAAEQRAQVHLNAIENLAVKEMAACVDSFASYLKLLHGNPPDAVRDELQRLAYVIASSAGTFGREALGAAALSTCELIDVFRQKHTWDREAIDVHCDAMRLLLDLPAAEATILVRGLSKVTSHLEHG